MAIAEMKKLLLVGYNDEREKMLKLLTGLNTVEICSTSELKDTVQFSAQNETDKINGRLARISFAFNFINQRRNDVKTFIKAKVSEKSALPKRPISILTPSKTIMDFEEFQKICESYDEYNEIIKKLEEYNNELLENKNKITRLKSFNEQLMAYSELTVPFSKFKDTKCVSVKLGLLPVANYSALEEVANIYPLTYLQKLNQNIKQVAVAILFHNDCKTEVLQKLSELEFVEANLDYDKNAVTLLEENNKQIEEIKNRQKEIALEAVKFEEFIPGLKLLYDYYNLELRKAEVNSGLRGTGKAYVLEGWIPTGNVEILNKKLQDSGLLYDVYFREPTDEETPPTLCVNNALVSKYEAVTNMYTPPKYREVDPNPFVTVFFFIIFGIMMSDAGYGLIMALAATVILRCSKPVKGDSKLIYIILLGGVSTVIWGIVFGGYFGLTFHPLWFAPLDDPISMLILALALGVVHILTGIGISAYAAFKRKDYMTAVFGNLSWYMVFLGIGLFALTLLVKNFALQISAYVILALGAVMIFIGGALGEGKSIISRIMGGFKSFYDIIGYFSDILSYCRIFGLGLATGAIAMVINTIAEIIIGMFPTPLAFIGVIISIPILVGFHLFNVAINVLGAYIHNCRLQYIEFFNRFYSGGGREFSPLGGRMKYVYIKPDAIYTEFAEKVKAEKNNKIKNKKLTVG